MVTNEKLYVFISNDFFTSNAERADRLIPQSATLTQAGGNSATFRLLAKNRKESTGLIEDAYEPSTNHAILVTTSSTSFAITKANTIFTGVINNISTSPIKGIDDETGSVSAVGMEEFLRQRIIGHSKMYHNSLLELRDIKRLPPFNFQRDSDSSVVGNSFPIDDLTEKYVFTNDLTAEFTAKWTRYRIIKHLCEYCWDADLPPITIEFDNFGVSTDPLNKEMDESVNLLHRTFLEAFDLILNETIGYKYTFVYDFANLEFILKVYPVSEDNYSGGSFPIQGLTRDIEFRKTIQPQYDAIHLIGSPIVACGTFYAANQTPGLTRPGQSLTPGWSDELATELVRGEDPPSDVEDTAAWLDQWRKGPKFDPIFKRFLVYNSNNGLLCKSATFYSTQQLTAKVTWNKLTSTTTVTDFVSSPTENYQPNYPALRALNSIPWYKGVKADGTDERDAEQKKNPELLPIQLWTVSHDGTTPEMYNLLSPADPTWSVATVKPLETGPGFEVEYPYKETLALPYFDPTEDLYDDQNVVAVYDPLEKDDSSDFRNICITGALVLDQHLEIYELRSGVTEPLRILYLDRPDLQFWYVRKYTVISNNGETPQEVGVKDVITRNNYPQAQELVDKVKAYAFRSRNEVALTYAGYEVPDQFFDIGKDCNYQVLGQVITDFEELDTTGIIVKTYTIGTMVESIVYDFNPEHPLVNISTRNLVQNYTGVTTALGGNLFNTLSDLKAEQVDIRKRLKDNISFKYSPGTGGTGGTNIIMGTILGGNATPLATNPATVYPDNKSVAITLETIDDDGRVLTTPQVDDWTSLDIPTDYAFGDNLPLLPNGLSYVRLVRPYTYGSKSWNSYLISPLLTDQGSTLEVNRVITNTTFDQINIFFNYEIALLDNVGPASFGMSITNQDGDSLTGTITITGYSLNSEGNGIILTLSQALTPEVHIVTLSFNQVAKTLGSPPLINATYSGTVTYGGDAYTVIICANRNSNQILNYGELVLIDETTLSITDSSGTTRTVPQILGPVNSAQVHDHKSFNKDGLGRAGFDVTFGGASV